MASEIIGRDTDLGYNHTQIFLEDTCISIVKEDNFVDQISKRAISFYSELKKVNEKILEHIEADFIKFQ